MHPPSVATVREGQRCRALGGRIPMDWVATFLRIAWQLCRGLGGNFPADWVAEFRGIRTGVVGGHPSPPHGRQYVEDTGLARGLRAGRPLWLSLLPYANADTRARAGGAVAGGVGARDQSWQLH